MTIKFKPYAYQAYAIDKIIENKKFGLFLDMGLGKTVSTLTAIEQLIYEHYDVQRVLVIAPLRVANHTWPEELEKWEHLSNLSYSVTTGSKANREKALSEDVDIYIINREQVAWIAEKYKKHWPFDMVVIDEFSSFKSHTSQRFKRLKTLAPKINRLVGLTGTPSPRNLMQLWPQIYLLDGGDRLGKTFTQFRARYFRPTYQIQPNVFNYELIEGMDKVIYDKIKDITVSMKAKDYLTMPELVMSEKKVELSKKERGIYEQLEKDMLVELTESDSAIVALSAGVLSQKLLQLANGAVYDDLGYTQIIHDKKLEMLDEIVEESQGESILVFYNFVHDRDRILERYKQAEVLNDENKNRWDNGNVEMLLCHPASAGHGLNLQQGGHIVVWFGLTWDLELYQQANARLYRQGQKETTVIHHIMTEDSIDQRVYDSLQNKSLNQDALLNAVKARMEAYNAD
ncbi:SNF2-related protein [Staphylococcus chromogenes]|uniref:SNF2-related protein n=1 Tax=Staphylococcus chromogenes TaxID=46126 RepID=UPI001E513F52|nr:DEAD/DEAH box helicase [Staphylococcus chromogenes]